MRTSAIIFFILITYFGVPMLASAANANGSSCTQNSNCISNYCNSFVCEAAPAGTVVTGGTASDGTVITNPNQGSGARTGQNITLINPLNTGECAPNGNCLTNFLNKILEFVIKIGTVVVVLMTVYVGYLFVVAQGAPDKIKDARQALLWTIVGALILLGSQAIAIAIKATVQAISVGQ